MYRFHHHPLLGTDLVVIIGDEAGAELAEDIDAHVVAEVARLEAIFTIFDDGSELQRWKRGEVDEPSPEFCEVMRRAAEWQDRSDGAFNLAATEISSLWRRASEHGEPPSPEEISYVVERVARPRFALRGGRPVPTGDVSQLQLHAFAKGWIVDRALSFAVAAAGGEDTTPCDTAGARFDVIVNAGGDLVHRGPHPQPVGIENPQRVYDNEPPVARVHIGNAGLATSGRARQGIEIAGRWYSHVIDPRTGYPVDHTASISVVAANAGSADAIATIAGIHPPEQAVAVAESLGAACLAIATDGTMTTNADWRRISH